MNHPAIVATGNLSNTRSILFFGNNTMAIFNAENHQGIEFGYPKPIPHTRFNSPTGGITWSDGLNYLFFSNGTCEAYRIRESLPILLEPVGSRTTRDVFPGLLREEALIVGAIGFPHINAITRHSDRQFYYVFCGNGSRSVKIDQNGNFMERLQADQIPVLAPFMLGRKITSVLEAADRSYHFFMNDGTVLKMEFKNVGGKMTLVPFQGNAVRSSISSNYPGHGAFAGFYLFEVVWNTAILFQNQSGL